MDKYNLALRIITYYGAVTFEQPMMVNWTEKWGTEDWTNKARLRAYSVNVEDETIYVYDDLDVPYDLSDIKEEDEILDVIIAYWQNKVQEQYAKSTDDEEMECTILWKDELEDNLDEDNFKDYIISTKPFDEDEENDDDIFFYCERKDWEQLLSLDNKEDFIVLAIH